MAELSPEPGPYGVFNVVATGDDRVKTVVGMVEKPAAGEPPLNLVATGRYLFRSLDFEALRRVELGEGGGAACRCHRTPHLRRAPQSTLWSWWHPSRFC